MAYRSRDRVLKVLAHEEADRVPYCAIGGPDVAAVVDAVDPPPDHRAFCLEGDFQMVTIEPPANEEAFASYLGELPPGAEVSYWGYASVRQRTSEGYDAGSLYLHPLAEVNSVEELLSFPFPDIAASGADEGLDRRVRELKQDEYTVLGQMSQTILETAYLLRGLERLMTDFYERPEYVEVLFEKIAEQRRFQARRLAEAGVDILRIGDDIAMQTGLLVSPEIYRERIRPFHASVIASAREVNPDLPVKYHSDGKLTALLPDLIEIGVNIVNPVQPECMDLVETKREFGRDLTLWGCMPVQGVMANGSRDDVVRHLRFLMEEIAPGGGLVLKFTNFLATSRSLENLGVFFETFYEMGRYERNPRSA